MLKGQCQGDYAVLWLNLIESVLYVMVIGLNGVQFRA